MAVGVRGARIREPEAPAGAAGGQGAQKGAARAQGPGGRGAKARAVRCWVRRRRVGWVEPRLMTQWVGCETSQSGLEKPAAIEQTRLHIY